MVVAVGRQRSARLRLRRARDDVFLLGWKSRRTSRGDRRSQAHAVSDCLRHGIILALFLTTAVGVQLLMPLQAINDSASDLLVALANAALPRPWGDLAIIVVIVSAIGSLETTLVSGSRLVFSMGRDRVLDERFGKLNARFLTPWNATIAIGLVSMALFGLAATSSSVNQIFTFDQRDRRRDRNLLRTLRRRVRRLLPVADRRDVALLLMRRVQLLAAALFVAGVAAAQCSPPDGAQI